MDPRETRRNGNGFGLRDLGGADLAGTARPEPALPGLSPLPTGAERELDQDFGQSPDAASVLAGDRPHGVDLLGPDLLGIATLLQPLAEFAVYRDTETPLTIGLLGGPGSGKSFALAKLLTMIQAFGGEPAYAGSAAFLHPNLTVRVDAAAFGEAPGVALAAAVYESLVGPFPQLAQEAAHAVRDPQVVAREAAEALNATRRRLDAERQNLAELESRRAKLVETILFEQAGSQVDSYARANRAKIERRLESFGFSGDAVQNYKSMLRDIAESGGPTARFGGALRALWAFKGQMRLLVLAVLLVLCGLFGDLAATHNAEWLAALKTQNQAFVPMADWLEAHVAWLAVVKQFAFVGAAVAVIANLWRAAQFLRPVFRGVALLEAEVAQRRHDLDGLYAHQTRRVDALVADVDAAARHAAEADRRAANTGAARRDPYTGSSPFEATTLQHQAERFFVALAAEIQQGARGTGRAEGFPTPRRVIVGLDNLDRVPQAKADAILEVVHRCLAHRAFVTVIAADPRRLGAATLERSVQIPVGVRRPLNHDDYAALVAHQLGRHGALPPVSESTPLDWSITDGEARLLTALAPLAGSTPRAVKRFVNLYRIARPQAGADTAVLAFMLALDQGGSAGEVAAVEKALNGDADTGPDFAPQQTTPRLVAALGALHAAQGVVQLSAAQHAAALAQTFSLRG